MTSPSGPDATIDRCRRMLEPIRNDLTNAHVHRPLWTALIEEIDRLPNPVTTLWRTSYTRMYLDWMLMTVRRVVEGTKDEEVSLGKLLKELATVAPSILVADLTPPPGDNSPSEPVVAMHVAALTREWGDESGHLRRDLLQEMRDQLYRDTKAVREWATYKLAHTVLDTLKGEPIRPPTLRELDQAIDDATRAYKRCVLLLKGVTTMVESPIYSPNWTDPLGRIFRP